MELYDFTYGWIGDGTPNNPYIIDGNDSVFDAHGIGAAIFIGNATIPITKSFIVTGWTILNCSSTSPQDIFNPGAGLVLYNCNGTINITGNHFSFSNYGAVARQCGPLLSMYNNTFSNDSGAGLLMIDTNGASLVGNTANGSQIGFALESSDSCQLRRNNLTDNKMGALLNHSSANVLLENNCSFNTRIGIRLNDSNGCLLQNNTCAFNLGTGSDEAGISILAGGSNNQIIGNSVRSNLQGIFVQQSPHTTIASNTVQGNSAIGIHTVGAYQIISENLCADNGVESISAENGGNLLIENNTCSGSGILVSSATSPKLANNRLQGPGGISLLGLSQGSVFGNRVENSSAEGISLSSCHGVQVRQNTLRYGATGIALRDSSGSNLIRLNVLSDFNLGISLNGASLGNQVLFNSIFQGTGVSGIRIQSTDQSIVRGNTLTSSGQFGIWIGPTISTSVLGNNVTGHLLDGILLEGAGHSNQVQGNNVNQNGVGINVSQASGNTITANTVKNNHQSGIYLSSSSGNLVSLNNCSQNGDLSPSGSGIFALNSQKDSIQNNSCWSNSHSGIGVAGGSPYVENNTCASNVEGVLVDSSAGARVRNNTIKLNQIGIALHGGSGAKLDHNNVSSSSSDGVRLSGESGAKVHDNLVTSNRGYGINVTNCPGPQIFLNILIGNNGSSGPQAFDDDATHVWNSTTPIGNLWSDWTSPDANRDGIVDLPYQLSGGGRDQAPLSSSVGPVNGLQGFPGTGNILVKWSVPNYSAVGPVTHYLLERHVGTSVKNLTFSGDVTSYNDNSIAAWTTYTYFVSARNAYGTSIGMNVSVGASDNLPPQLTILFPLDRANLNLSSFSVAWNGTDGASGSGISRYEVSLENGPWSDVGKSLSYPLTNLAQGPHRFAVRAWDIVGNSATNTTDFVIDTYAPQLSITAPGSGSLFNTTSVAVTWTIGADNGTSVRYQVKLDNGQFLSVGSNQSVTFSSLAQGDHLVLVRALDAANNLASASVAFRIDSDAPVVVITAPTAPYIGSLKVTVTWTVQLNGAGASRSEVSLDHGAWDLVGANTSIGLTLSEGAHHFEVRAFDEANNSGNASISFTVDITAPQLVIESPLNDTWVSTQKVTVSWNGTDVVSGIAWYEVRVDNDSTWINRSLLKQYQTPALSEGDHSVEVRGFDRAGNNATAVSRFRLDSIAPQVTGISPPYGAPLNQTSVTFRWNATDLYSGLNSTTVSIDGGVPIQVGLNTSFIANNLSDGEHGISVRVYDNATNVGLWTSRVLVDTIAPQLNITDPKNDVIIQARTVIVAWTTSDNSSGLRTIYGKLDGGSWEDWTLAYNYHMVNPLPAGMTEGPHTVYVKSWDNAGNFRVRSVNFTVDVSAPIVQITSPLQNSWTNNTTVLVVWIGSDYPSGMDHFEVRIDGGNWTNVGLNTSRLFVELAIGSHLVEVKGFGNTTQNRTAAVSFGIDQTPPMEVIINPPAKYVRNRTIYLTWEPPVNSSDVRHYEARVTKTYWNGGQFITVNGTWFNSGPSTSLSLSDNPDGEYNVSIRAVDRAGNIGPASGANLTLDATPPSIISYAPLGQVTSLLPQVVVQFSEPMNHASVHIEIPGFNGGTAWSGNSITFTPDQALAFNQTYLVSVTGKDLAGNPLPAYGWTFRTIPNLGTVAGKVVNDLGSPVSGAIVRLENGLTTATDKNGAFSLTGSGGAHILTIQVKGFEDKVFNVTITAGTITNVGLAQMQKAPSDYSWVIVLTFVLLIAVAAELLYLQRKRKK